MRLALRLTGILTPLLLLILLTRSTIRADFPGLNGKIAFTTNEEGNSEVYLINADGSGKINITRSEGEDVAPRWSPDGRKIAFSTQRDHPTGGQYEIYTTNADGSGQTRLTYTNAFNLTGSWSPDGRKIVFTSARDGNYEIYSMNADGTDQTRLTNNPAFDLEPEYSPDGRQIVFSSGRDGHSEIYVMNADGTQPVRLTSGADDNFQARWSPDGRKIVFGTGRHASAPRVTSNFDEIYVMNPDGSQQTRVTNDQVADFTPSWAPDGGRIVFATRRYTFPTTEIAFMNTDGTNPIRITNTKSGSVAGEPNWQPVPILTVSRIEPSAVIGGEPARATVRFNAVVPSSGLNIAVISNNPRVSVPSLLTASAGSDHINFDITTRPTAELFTAHISIVVQGVAFDFSLTVLPSPPTISISIPEGETGVVPADRKLEASLLLGAAFPAPISGEITLSFRSDAQLDPMDDPAVRFGNQSRTIAFDVPSNSVLALFPLLGSTLDFYTGTIAGTITLTVSKLETLGNSILPSDPARRVLSVPRSPPVVTDLNVESRTANALDLVVAGYAVTRTVLDGEFQFSGVNLQTTRLTVPLSEAIQSWYRNPQSQQFGSRFSLRITFNASAGDARSVQAVTVSLRNTVGVSQPRTVTVP